jgi:CHAT domain
MPHDMGSGGAASSRLWMEISLIEGEPELKATAQAIHGRNPSPHVLGPSFAPDAIRRFSEEVAEAAARGEHLGGVLSQAQALHGALFREKFLEVLHTLRGTAGHAPILLRLMLQSPSLHAIPWEAMCQPGTGPDFLGTSPELFVARGVHSVRPWQPREVTGAIRLLSLSPSDERGPDRLKSFIEPSIQSGEIECLPPLAGAQARIHLFNNRLKQGPIPHVLHFIGHGRVTEGVPFLRLADRDGQQSWHKVELLAQSLEHWFREDLRLVVLEACEGAQPGVLASAAERFVRAGADAVVAYLWPVKTDVARCGSESFYRSLSGTVGRPGDVAASLHDARRGVLLEFEESAEAFSPVLYLRGQDSLLFDFRRSEQGGVSSPAPVAVAAIDARPVAPSPTPDARPSPRTQPRAEHAPNPKREPRALSLAESGIHERTATIALAGCVAMQHPEKVARALEKCREDLLHDPFLLSASEKARLQQQGFVPGVDAAHTRARMLEFLTTADFDIFVFYAPRSKLPEDEEERRRTLFTELLKERLAARKWPVATIRGRHPMLRSLVESVGGSLREKNRRHASTPEFLKPRPIDFCLMVAEYACDIIRTHLERIATGSLDPNAPSDFERIRNQFRESTNIVTGEEHYRKRPLP